MNAKQLVAANTPAAVGLLAWFEAIPWPNIAACLSSIFVALQIGYWLYRRFKK